MKSAVESNMLMLCEIYWSCPRWQNVALSWNVDNVRSLALYFTAPPPPPLSVFPSLSHAFSEGMEYRIIGATPFSVRHIKTSLLRACERRVSPGLVCVPVRRQRGLIVCVCIPLLEFVREEPEGLYPLRSDPGWSVPHPRTDWLLIERKK